MVRDSASEKNRDLARQFACTACAHTDNVNDMLARSGPHSLFRALVECCPRSVRCDEVTNLHGLAEAEFNKVLQAAGFQRERDRRVNAMTRSEDPSGAGMYLFCCRRWRDVNNPVDRGELVSGWKSICDSFPVVAQHCTLERFLSVISKFHDNWKPNAGRAKKKPKKQTKEVHLSCTVSPVQSLHGAGMASVGRRDFPAHQLVESPDTSAPAQWAAPSIMAPQPVIYGLGSEGLGKANDLHLRLMDSLASTISAMKDGVQPTGESLAATRATIAQSLRAKDPAVQSWFHRTTQPFDSAGVFQLSSSASLTPRSVGETLGSELSPWSSNNELRMRGIELSLAANRPFVFTGQPRPAQSSTPLAVSQGPQDQTQVALQKSVPQRPVPKRHEPTIVSRVAPSMLAASIGTPQQQQQPVQVSSPLSGPGGQWVDCPDLPFLTARQLGTSLQQQLVLHNQAKPFLQSQLLPTDCFSFGMTAHQSPRPSVKTQIPGS
mmetsp:Transcript_44042/g.68854  ORF Transcript_44042/g.68854 Transcript_44042/m.68854 type:complete len:491 (-) Transcript_44042:84-1556(-)